MADTGAVRTPGFWLRVVELVFGIIAFAVIADWSGWSRAAYAIFCGCATMLGSLVLIICLLMGKQSVLGSPSLVYDIIFCVFWLCCAALLSDSLSALDAWGWGGSGMSRLQTSVAFSWLTWFAFIGSIVMDVMDMRAGVGYSGRAGPAAPAAGDKFEGTIPGADARVVSAV